MRCSKGFRLLTSANLSSQASSLNVEETSGDLASGCSLNLMGPKLGGQSPECRLLNCGDLSVPGKLASYCQAVPWKVLQPSSTEVLAYFLHASLPGVKTWEAKALRPGAGIYYVGFVL